MSSLIVGKSLPCHPYNNQVSLPQPQIVVPQDLKCFPVNLPQHVGFLIQIQTNVEGIYHTRTLGGQVPPMPVLQCIKVCKACNSKLFQYDRQPCASLSGSHVGMLSSTYPFIDPISLLENNYYFHYYNRQD